MLKKNSFMSQFSNINWTLTPLLIILSLISFIKIKSIKKEKNKNKNKTMKNMMW